LRRITDRSIPIKPINITIKRVILWNFSSVKTFLIFILATVPATAGIKPINAIFKFS